MNVCIFTMSYFQNLRLNQPKVPYFSISPLKFVFAHFLAKIECVRKKSVFFSFLPLLFFPGF